MSYPHPWQKKILQKIPFRISLQKRYPLKERYNSIIHNNEQLYLVSEVSRFFCQLDILSLDGKHLETAPLSHGLSAGDIRYGPSLAFDSNGLIYVSDNQHRVQVFSSDFKVVRSWKVPGGGDLVIYDNLVYVLIPAINQVSIYTLAGILLERWKNYGSNLGSLTFPKAITIYQNEVYIVDSGNNRIQVFSMHGKYLRHWKYTCTSQSVLPTIRCGFGMTFLCGEKEIQIFNCEGIFFQKFEGISLTIRNGVIYTIGDEEELLVYNIE